MRFNELAAFVNEIRPNLKCVNGCWIDADEDTDQCLEETLQQWLEHFEHDPQAAEKAINHRHVEHLAWSL